MHTLQGLAPLSVQASPDDPNYNFVANSSLNRVFVKAVFSWQSLCAEEATNAARDLRETFMASWRKDLGLWEGQFQRISKCSCTCKGVKQFSDWRQCRSIYQRPSSQHTHHADPPFPALALVIARQQDFTEAMRRLRDGDHRCHSAMGTKRRERGQHCIRQQFCHHQSCVSSRSECFLRSQAELPWAATRQLYCFG